MQNKVRSSPARHTFLSSRKPDLGDFWDQVREEERKRIDDPEWQKNNMEYDLRTSDYIFEKCQDLTYAQHLYAAMCNNEFMKNDVFPILAEQTWSCSWRHSGGIVADIREEGDYIDWYCSGIKSDPEYEKEQFIFEDLTEDQKEHYLLMQSYVAESVVTDEIRQDLFKLGWIVLENKDTGV
jgi:hypothetical protein